MPSCHVASRCAPPLGTRHQDLDALGNEPRTLVRGDKRHPGRRLERTCGSPIEDRAVLVRGDLAHARFVDQDRHRSRGADVSAGQAKSQAAL